MLLAPGSFVSVAFSFSGQAFSGNPFFPAPPGSGLPTILLLARGGFISGGTGDFFNIALAGAGGIASWNLILGNEVKTVVPEPATGSMLGLGLMGLAGAAAAARRRQGPN